MKNSSFILFACCILGCNTGAEAIRPMQVETLDAVEITDAGAIGRGRIIDGNGRIEVYGIELFHENDASPVVFQMKSAPVGDVFSIVMSGLEQGRNYRFRAFASDGTACYGDALTFTTATYLPPEVETLEAANIASHVADFRGSVANRNGRISSYGVELVYENDTMIYRRTAALAGNGFTVAVSDLAPQRTYRFRAFVDDGSIRYGNAKTVSTTEPEIIAGHIPLADPFILHHNGVYYAYGTRNADVGKGYSAYISHDLVRWRRHSSPALDKKDCYGESGFWAPEVYYRRENSTFYMFYTADEHICVATAASPLGPFTQEVKQSMHADRGIDNTLFVDEDGKAYLFFVRFTGGNVIWGAELEDDWKTIRTGTLKQCIATAADGWERVQGQIAEGPSVFRHNGVYYLLYSANHYQSQDYAVGYATAASPLGTWTKAAENPILRRPAGQVGSGHGAKFVDVNGNLRYVFHTHFSTESIAPRKMYITDMSIDPSGKVTMSGEHITGAIEYKTVR
ncbi:MAG: glycoside hydrolase family 43 protein [Bacteroidales bacterium]|jgi:GH43 family beta-xylosidase|nr:glycoside hydrolase family 43 protein [Bacteroidales bacterium]